MSAKLVRIGFFAFVQNDLNPIDSLKSALQPFASSRYKIRDTLIVLPEAFNKAAPYHNHPEPPRHNARSFLNRIADVAKRYEVAFVVGVLHDRKRNSAYFVTGACPPRWMCDKEYDERQGQYVPCRRNCFGENPIYGYKGTDIGALICSDAVHQGVGVSAKTTLLRKLSRRASRRQIICVPAAMGSQSWGTLKDSWDGRYVVFANSVSRNYGGRASFITNKQHTEVKRFCGNENTLVVRSFAEINVIQQEDVGA